MVVLLPRQCGQHWPLRSTGTLQLAGGHWCEKHWMVPFLQVQLVQGLTFQESPASRISPSLEMQYPDWLPLTGRRGLSWSSVHTGDYMNMKSKLNTTQSQCFLCGAGTWVVRSSWSELEVRGLPCGSHFLCWGGGHTVRVHCKSGTMRSQ